MNLHDFVDPADIAEALRSDPDLIAQEVDLAERAADYWRSIAPVDSGTYRDSIHAGQNGGTVYVIADDPIAHLIEYGSEDTPEFACRARTESHFNSGGQ